jgi:hypothetical protein
MSSRPTSADKPAAAPVRAKVQPTPTFTFPAARAAPAAPPADMRAHDKVLVIADRYLDLDAAVKRISARAGPEPAAGTMPIGAGVGDLLTSFSNTVSSAVSTGVPYVMSKFRRPTHEHTLRVIADMQREIDRVANIVGNDLLKEMAADAQGKPSPQQIDGVIANIRSQLGQQQEALINYINWTYGNIADAIRSRMSQPAADEVVLDTHAAGLAHGALVAALALLVTGATAYGGYKLFKYLRSRLAAPAAAAPAAALAAIDDDEGSGMSDDDGSGVRAGGAVAATLVVEREPHLLLKDIGDEASGSQASGDEGL